MSRYKQLIHIINAHESTGVAISVNELKDIAKEVKKLEHHRDTTVGLIATDRPDLILDTTNYNEIFWKIEYE